jgi:enoyl-CoA hydratase/carnithine racemase
MSDDLLLIQHDGDLTTLTLNSPATINALSRPMLTRLGAALRDIAASPARVVILRGAGRNFCAGCDLREIQGLRDAPDQGRAGLTALFTLCNQVMQAIAALPQPVIAQVQGVATAAGCQLAASCDMVVAAETARFGVNGVNIGLFCHTPLVALSRKIAPAQAFEMAATGEFIPAARAQSLGLVTRLAPPEALEETTLALARTLAQKLPVALSLGKRGAAQPLAEAYATATALMVDNLMTAETAEGIQAFLDKRPPSWAQ